MGPVQSIEMVASTADAIILLEAGFLGDDMPKFWIAMIIAGIMLLAPGASRAYEPSAITQVVLLGVGNPNPIPETSGPATAIIVNGTAYIIDAGPGVVRRAALAAREHGIPALAAENLNHLFLTHLHWDHSAGLPDILLSGWTMGRDRPMMLFGPPGSGEMAQNIIEAYAEDIDRRVNGLEPTNNEGWRVDTTIGRADATAEIFRDENITVESFPVCHGNWDPAFGYRFTTPDRVIVISGDTTYCPIIAEMAAGADILIHEVIDGEALANRPDAWRAYHTASHTTATDLARIANQAQPGLLILHHQNFWDGSAAAIMEQISDGYEGEVAWGHDLDVF
jgi:ribonuclease BN (tRNA processing enzyme)